MDFTAIIIIAIICSMVVSIVKIVKKSNQSDTKASAQFENYEQDVEQKISSLQARIEVLEKIVTEEKYSLNKAFSELKN
jgi:peptidoglycan hydrolase CwlO-like protein